MRLIGPFVLRVIVGAMVLAGCGNSPSTALPSEPAAASSATTGSPSSSLSGRSSPSASMTPARSQAAGGSIVGIVALPQGGLGVSALAIEGPDVWVSDSESSGGYVLRIRAGAIASRTRVGWAPGSVAVTPGSVWVSDTTGDGSRPTDRQNDVARIDPTSGREVARIAVSLPGRIVVADEVPWVAAGDGSSVASTIDRIDPATDAIIAKTPIEGAISDVAVGNGAIWVASASLSAPAGWLSRLDPDTGRVTARVALPDRPGSVLAVGRALDVLLPGPDAETVRVVRVDPAAVAIVGPVVATAALVGRAAASGEQIWVASSQTVTRLAAADLVEADMPIQLPPAAASDAIAVAAVGSDVWVLQPGALVQIRSA